VKTLLVKKNNNNHIFNVVVLLRLSLSERRRGHEETLFFFFLFRSPQFSLSLEEEEIAVSGKMGVFLLLNRSCCSAKIRAQQQLPERN